MAKKKTAAKKPAAKAQRTVPDGVEHILSFDLSVNHTGYAVWDRSDGIASWGTIDNDRDEVPSFSVRIALTLGKIRQLLDSRPGKKLIVIETLPFSQRSNSIELGMLQGVIRHELLMRALEVLCLAPLQIRKFVTGHAKSEKGLVIKYIDKRFGYDCENDNAADALGLMTIGRAFLNRRQVVALVVHLSLSPVAF